MKLLYAVFAGLLGVLFYAAQWGEAKFEAKEAGWQDVAQVHYTGENSATVYFLDEASLEMFGKQAATETASKMFAATGKECRAHAVGEIGIVKGKKATRLLGWAISASEREAWVEAY